MVVKILIVFVCFLDLAVNIQVIKIFLGYKVHNYKIVNILLIGLVNIPSCIFAFQSSGDKKSLLLLMYYLGHFLIYSIIYRKLNLKILYIFLFTINTPQIYTNIIKIFITNYALVNILAFSLDAAMWGAVLFYIKKNIKYFQIQFPVYY